MKKILTIAGSDGSGGAGIQADIKTITSHKMYAMSVITALTAQNTTGVYGVMDATPEFVEKQMDAVFTDIYPDAVKIGMVSDKDIITVITEKLIEYGAKNIVLDPVMISTSGSRLLKEDAIHELTSKLMPAAKIITPNIPEAECLCGFKIQCKDDMLKAAVKISKNFFADILIKGGHLDDCSDDVLYTNGKFYWFEQPRINNSNTHGTGCTLSSAIACNLAAGMDIKNSIGAAKEYITGALRANLDLGKGNGPLNHGWNIQNATGILQKEKEDNMLYEYTLQTQRENFINITTKVKEAVRQSGIKDGICVIYCPHTTAGITINENADPDVVTDMLLGLDKAFPDRREFRHAEENSTAHLKSSFAGASQTVIVREGGLLLGTWQGIYFCEFDGPRNRRFYVKVV